MKTVMSIRIEIVDFSHHQPIFCETVCMSQQIKG